MASASTPAPRIWTYEDYLRTPDDGQRYEIIDGDLVVTPAPTTTHQTAVKRLMYELMRQLEEAGKATAFIAPVDLILSKTCVVMPDLLAIAAHHTSIIKERGVEAAPDLVIEVLSSKPDLDRVRKRKLYAEHGVPEYWLVDPATRTVEVLKLVAAAYETLQRCGPGDRIKSGVFAELEIDVDGVFRK